MLPQRVSDLVRSAGFLTLCVGLTLTGAAQANHPSHAVTHAKTPSLLVAHPSNNDNYPHSIPKMDVSAPRSQTAAVSHELTTLEHQKFVSSTTHRTSQAAPAHAANARASSRSAPPINFSYHPPSNGVAVGAPGK
jgi:hypothetical protein